MVSDIDEITIQFSFNHSSKGETTKSVSLIVENKKNQTKNIEVLVHSKGVVIVVSLLRKLKPR